jgi:hypothetical protein
MKHIIGRAIELIKYLQYGLAGGRIKQDKVDRMLNELKTFNEEVEEFDNRRLVRIGLAESKEGMYLVELFYNSATAKFTIKFPELEKEPFYELPKEYLPMIRQVLDDVIWCNGKYTRIPDKT